MGARACTQRRPLSLLPPLPDIRLGLVNFDGRSGTLSRRPSGNSRPLPPLDYSDEMFDLVYAVSVFTHLSEEFQLPWLGELRRILKPNGVLLATVYNNSVWESLDTTTVAEIKRKGVLFQTSDKLKGICPTWYQTNFETEQHVKAKFNSRFRVLKYLRRGMGDLDVVVAERPA